MPENSKFRFRISFAARGAALVAIAISVAACNSNKPNLAKAELDTAPKFTEEELGVKSSPRVTELRQTPKGGGRYQVGKPYKVRGKWYTPMEDPTYVASGKASWYGPNFHGRLTANGEVYNQYTLSAAHPTMPLPSYARVTNLNNGASVLVRVNDRGPFHGNRVIDVSSKAAELLDFKKAGVANVKVEYVGKARLEGSDEKFLLASYRAPGSPEIAPGATQPGTMIAMAQEPANPIAGAIDEQFSIGGVTLASIPVPVRRPDLFMEGTPMFVAKGSGSALMGYSAEDTGSERILAAFAAIDPASRPAQDGGRDAVQVDPELASRTAVISLGVFHDPAAGGYVRQLFADTGLVSSDATFADGRQGWEIKMLVGGDAAQSVLELARQRGFESARILPPSLN